MTIKDLLSEYYYMAFKCLISVPRITDAKLCVLLSKENGISRNVGSEIYILSPTSTVGTFATLQFKINQRFSW